MNIQKPRLLTTDTLVAQETRNAICSEYSIFDNNDTQIVQIIQTSPLGRRMLGIGIKYDIFGMNENDKESDKLLIITDPSNAFSDIYKVFIPNGARIATVKTRRFGLRPHPTSSVKGLSDVDVDGDF